MGPNIHISLEGQGWAQMRFIPQYSLYNVLLIEDEYRHTQTEPRHPFRYCLRFYLSHLLDSSPIERCVMPKDGAL